MKKIIGGGLANFKKRLRAAYKAFTQSEKEDKLPRGFSGAKLARKALAHDLTRRARPGQSPGRVVKPRQQVMRHV